MTTAAAIYAAGAVSVGAVLVGGYRARRLAWYNVVAGVVLWPAVLVLGLVRAYQLSHEDRS